MSVLGGRHASGLFGRVNAFEALGRNLRVAVRSSR